MPALALRQRVIDVPGDSLERVEYLGQRGKSLERWFLGVRDPQHVLGLAHQRLDLPKFPVDEAFESFIQHG